VAQHQLARLPIPIRQHALRQLEFLAEYPSLLSKPSHFPYSEKCQRFPMNDFDYEGRRWELDAFFQYSQDETQIHILTIGFSSYNPTDLLEPD
jgi:hypothetical protein